MLEIGVPFRRRADKLWVESQALNGLRLWSNHFDHVTVCANVLPAQAIDDSTIVWADPSELLAQGRLGFEALPWGYHPKAHFRYRNSVRDRFELLIQSHRFLCFSGLGLFGAWGSVAAEVARRQGRPYSVWLDWVLHAMNAASDANPIQRIKRSLISRLVKRETDRSIGACSLGLFHGKTVYNAYAPICRQPELVHDVHVHPEDAISDQQLTGKIAALASGSPLRVGYVGRVHPMKAPMQWIDALAGAARVVGAARIEATWLGDGPLLGAARDHVQALGLVDSIRFEGFVSDRAEVLSFLRKQNLLLFCHVTPESPRCLLESLISGTPIVGYDSEYARDLAGDRGGVLLTPVGNVGALAEALIRLADERADLERLTVEAAASRSLYNDESVFAHRSNLIKRYL